MTVTFEDREAFGVVGDTAGEGTFIAVIRMRRGLGFAVVGGRSEAFAVGLRSARVHVQLRGFRIRDDVETRASRSQRDCGHRACQRRGTEHLQKCTPARRRYRIIPPCCVAGET